MKKLIIILISIFTITINLYSQKFTSISYCKCDTIHLIKDTSNLSLIIYTPVHCKLGLTALRPDSNQTNILFTAPAAFTTKNYKEVVGRFVGIDTIIENPTENETGLCSINNKDVYIGPISDSSTYYYNAILDTNTFYFQQMLLINNYKKVECTIFGNQKPTFRRALALKNGNAYVVESLNRMNINDFIDTMVEQGYSDAIYMDMGTWSEGFYTSQNNEKISIGRLKQNTRYQTNWLIFIRE